MALLLLVVLFCSHPFFGLNALLISGIEPLLRTLVRKYVEGKGSVADSVCGSTMWGNGLLLPSYFPVTRESGCCLRSPALKWTFWTLRVNFEKLNSPLLPSICDICLGECSSYNESSTPTTAKMDLKYMLCML